MFKKFYMTDSVTELNGWYWRGGYTGYGWVQAPPPDEWLIFSATPLGVESQRCADVFKAGIECFVN